MHQPAAVRQQMTVGNDALVADIESGQEAAKIAVQEHLSTMWLSLHLDSPKAVSVTHRDFLKLSNFPLQRRKRDNLERDTLNLEPGDHRGVAILFICHTLLRRLASEAKDAALPRIYDVPKVSFGWEANGVWAEVEMVFYELVSKGAV